MPRPKDAKIWNEDLVAGLEARHEKSLREGKRDAHTWRVGRDKIQAVRGDIYQFRTGSIVNMPTGLTKRVQRCCEDIIRGVTNVYPDGHVPTNGGGGGGGFGGGGLTNGGGGGFGGGGFGGGGGFEAMNAVDVSSRYPHAASSAAGTPSNSNNPFTNDHYMKSMKIRGGAYAILMAFHYSQTEVLRKNQICQEAQQFCDEQMESNYHAGRMYGAWKAIDTLKSHHLVTEQGFATHTGGGFRDRPHEYTLTRDGKLFIAALLMNRPEAAAAARQAAGEGAGAGSGAFATGAARAAYGGNGGLPFHDPFARTLNHIPSYLLGGVRSTPISRSSNADGDRVELEQWIETAELGDQKEFKVGKERRKHLHRLCDTFQEQYPGLIFTHSSNGTARARILTIQVVAKPSMSGAASSCRKRPLSPETPGRSFTGCGQSTAAAAASPATKRPRDLTPAQNAALAAMRRQEQAKEEAELKRAIAESAKLAHTPPRPRRDPLDKEIQEIDIDDDDDEAAMLQRAIEESLQESSKKPPAVGSRKQRSQQSPASSKGNDDWQKKPAAKACDVLSSDSDSVDDELLKGGPIFSSSAKKREGSKVLSSDSDSDDDGLLKGGSNDNCSGRKAGPSVARKIDLSQSDDEDEEKKNSGDEDKGGTIEIQDSQEEPIDLLDSQPQVFDNSSDDDDDDVVIVENDSSAAAADSTPTDHHMSEYALTVMIDNRERSRNATPRMLRMELTRHLTSGPLRAVWPTASPPAQVEEVCLEYGDFGYTLAHTITGQSHRLGVSVERKRVNDLVQRSYDADHLAQLFRMQQLCSLSVLLIEYDTRMVSSVTAYKAQNREGSDPFDTTITCEEDVYRMFGRVVLSSDTIKFIQTKDEQASLRAIGALGLMAVSAPTEFTTGLTCKGSGTSRSDGAQALCDQLKQGGIPWRLAQRVSRVVGGTKQLEALYRSCSSETAKSKLLSHLVSNDNRDQADLRSSAAGWSDAIYRIVAHSTRKPPSSAKFTGEGALLMHKDMIEDHGRYLSILHEGCSPEEALDRVLSRPPDKTTSTARAVRSVSIHLTEDQAARYFPSGGDGAFYKLCIASSRESAGNLSAIIMRAECESLASKKLHIFELEGSELVDLIQKTWKEHVGSGFVELAKEITKRVDIRCRSRGATSRRESRIVLICGLQPALDNIAKKPGYRTEVRTVLDMVLSDIMIRYNITVIQALRKKVEDRVNVVRQLALACLHYGFLVESSRKSSC